MIRILAALACLALSACTMSPVPITSADGKQSDDRFVGLWQYKIDEAGEEKTELMSIKSNDTGDLFVQALYEDGRPQDEGDFRAVVARLGEERYLSATHPDPGEPIYILMRYEFQDDDHFVIYAPDLDQLKAATDSNVIAGKWVEDRHMSSIQLGASEKELRAFVIAHGARIFSIKTFELARVKPRGGGVETTPSRR